MKIEAPDIPERPSRGRKDPGAGSGEEESQLFDSYCLERINEYFYGVRIYPGQDPNHIFIGWVTSQYHYHNTMFNYEMVRRVTVKGCAEM